MNLVLWVVHVLVYMLLCGAALQFLDVPPANGGEFFRHWVGIVILLAVGMHLQYNLKRWV